MWLEWPLINPVTTEVPRSMSLSGTHMCMFVAVGDNIDIHMCYKRLDLVLSSYPP